MVGHGQIAPPLDPPLVSLQSITPTFMLRALESSTDLLRTGNDAFPQQIHLSMKVFPLGGATNNIQLNIELLIRPACTIYLNVRPTCCEKKLLMDTNLLEIGNVAFSQQIHSSGYGCENATLLFRGK